MATNARTTDIGEELRQGIVSAARTSLGDTLRSAIYFTPSAFDVLYVRNDLYGHDADVREAKSELVEIERTGLSEGPVRSAIGRQHRGSNIGEYEFTVRFHDDGFVIRMLRGDAGVLLTTDDMNVQAFEDAFSVIKQLLDGE